ncbi:FAD-dependent oxidoreductase [Zafaria sp. J156]|uniref:glycerol-3-phosphate dehydrogenase/oxidase n=1 Tax=Zafaria sp. J156 TaxID=3116490 RepID=UPI002E786635|nr:glycerol-3-phosphate dehydrogenase/oxidase [Zafaria sp. J156]MEE1621143.1 glycerol-3-phosphate dehydrogenase/oxidase [Zafaria sp. J156]
MPQSLPPRAHVQAFKDRPRAEVLVVGGGINGVATFRDLALQGVDVALVERGDYCQGASGASSHMIHGGIRYLENGEFRLVKESVAERNGLLAIAPHHVKPLRTTIPVFSTFSGILGAPLRFLRHRNGRPTERGAVLIKAGLVMYDCFAGLRAGRRTPWHSFHGRRKSLAALPRLRPDVKYTATYFDASVHNPERLTLDVLQSGLEAHPAARASNYLGLVRHDADGAVLRDELTGEEFRFQADVVVNATGAWADLTNDSVGRPSAFMGGTKGSHIVLDHPELLRATGGREIFFEHRDGRIVLIYPIGDRVLVGTTDIEADMTEDPVCTDDETRYFFELIRHVFPDIAVGRDDIVYTFSGVRPLPRHADTQPGFVSRDYRIERTLLAGGTPMLTLVGGKWTTFRALAEHLARDVLAESGRTRTVQTQDLAIGGGRDYPLDPAALEDWFTRRVGRADRRRLEVLLERYGTGADRVLEHCGAGDRPLRACDELTVGELGYLARHEQAARLVDVFIRRTSLAFRGLVTNALLEEAATVLARHHGWDEAETAAEVEHARDVLRRRHGVRLSDEATPARATASGRDPLPA